MDLLISFDDLRAGKSAVKKLVQAFTRAGAAVASTDVDEKTKRSSGINYRQVHITFVDNQMVSLGVKTTGDIFEARVNGSVLPIKSQDDQRKAVAEIVSALDAGRAKHQAKLARQKVALPKGITTAAPKMEEKLRQIASDLDQQIGSAKARIAELKSELGDTLDAVDVPNSSFTEPAVIEATSIVTRLLAGEVLDEAAYSHSLNALRLALDVVETNAPINVAEGNIAQAELEEKAAGDFRAAIEALTKSSAALDAVPAEEQGGEEDTEVGVENPEQEELPL